MPRCTPHGARSAGALLAAAFLSAYSTAGSLLAQPGAEGPAADSVCPQSAPTSAAVAGVVRGSLRGAPIPEALVVVSGGGLAQVGAVTDSSGVYFFCDLPGRPLRLEARFGQWAKGPVPVDLEAGRYLRQDFTLGPGTGDFIGKEGSDALGRVAGRIRDRTTDAPVSDARVEIPETGRRTVSDARGRFLLTGVRPGERTLRVQHVAFGTTEHRLDVPARTTATVDLALAPEAIELDPILVTGIRDRELERRGFYERRGFGGETGAGRFFTREEIRSRNPLELSGFLAALPGVDRDCAGSGRRCALRFAGTGCAHAVLYLDGVRSPGRIRIDELVRPHEVAGVEIYRGVGELAAEFADPVSRRCGAVVIWTVRGR